MPRRPTPRHVRFVMAGAVGLVGATPALAQLLPVVGPQRRIDPGGTTFAANETTAAASEANPMEIIAGWNDWRASGGSEIIRAGFSVSLDGGESWDDLLVRPPAPHQTSVEGDPMTAFDPRTGTLWAGAISFSGNGGMFVARKDPGSPTFEPAVMARTGAGIDKCWMVAGPRPGEPDTTRLYIAYNQGVIRSDDMGDTWTSPVSLGGGIGFLPRVGPGGELYVSYWDFGSSCVLARSLDGGQNFTFHTIATRMDVWGTQEGSRFPGTFRVPPFVHIEVDRGSGQLYAVYADTSSFSGGNADVDLYFTTSVNQGTTWTPPIVLPFDDGTSGDQLFPWIEADGDGRLHVLFYDSGNTVQDDDDVNGMFDAYYAYSVNGGDTWSKQRLTPQSFNSNDDGLDRPSQFLGDYLGLTVAGHRAYPVYVDTAAGDPDTFTNVIEVPVVGDTNGDGLVNFDDLLNVLSSWGPCGGCPADIDGSGEVEFADLLVVLAEWG